MKTQMTTQLKTQMTTQLTMQLKIKMLIVAHGFYSHYMAETKFLK
jgi:hypothetical protein